MQQAKTSKRRATAAAVEAKSEPDCRACRSVNASRRHELPCKIVNVQKIEIEITQTSSSEDELRIKGELVHFPARWLKLASCCSTHLWMSTLLAFNLCR